MTLPRLRTHVVAAVVITAGAVLAACGDAEDDPTARTRNGRNADASVPRSTFVGDGGATHVAVGPFTDFPSEPIVVAGEGGALNAPANSAALFASAQGGGTAAPPCLIEPEIGSLVPKNWLRPRFRFTAAGGENLFEVRLHAENQVNDLVVYTSATSWTMPAPLWDSFRSHSAGVPITISVRGAKLDAAGTAIADVTQAMSGPWELAPVEAPGSIVYWRIIGQGAADLNGFRVGDESVRRALDPNAVEQQPTKCVGCHISSPDGKYAIFASDSYGGGYGVGIASVEEATSGKKPPFLTPFGEASLTDHLQGVTTVAASHWNPGKHLVVGSMSGELRWVNLDATDEPSSRGIVARAGDPHTGPNSPSFSHDGQKLVYVSSNANNAGRPTGDGNDVFIVPFNDGAGGNAMPLAGAATDESEYYPSFASDDTLVAFSRTPKSVDAYSAAAAEVYVVPSSGGQAHRLAANDPPACTQVVSPGVENSWPRWAPAAQTVNGKTYYWLVFSSTRLGGGSRQLFMAPIVVDAAGAIHSYKAVYLWNQPANERNHTPAWDVFAIPPARPR